MDNDRCHSGVFCLVLVFSSSRSIAASSFFRVGRGSMGRTAGREADAWATRRTVKTCRPRPGFAAFAQASTHHQWHAAFLDARVAASHGAPWLARAPSKCAVRLARICILWPSTLRPAAIDASALCSSWQIKFGAKRLLPACMKCKPSRHSSCLPKIIISPSSSCLRSNPSQAASSLGRSTREASPSVHAPRSKGLKRPCDCLAPHLHPSVQTCHCRPRPALDRSSTVTEGVLHLCPSSSWLGQRNAAPLQIFGFRRRPVPSLLVQPWLHQPWSLSPVCSAFTSAPPPLTGRQGFAG